MADTKVSGLPSLVLPISEDFLLVIDDPLGTPTSKKVSLKDFFGNVSSNTTISGLLAAANTTINGVMTITGDTLNITTIKTPASATATGTKGDIVWDINFIYVCTATDTWKRVAISTWV